MGVAVAAGQPTFRILTSPCAEPLFHGSKPHYYSVKLSASREVSSANRESSIAGHSAVSVGEGGSVGPSSANKACSTAPVPL